MFNSSLNLMYLESGDELQARIHQSLDETFQVIASHQNVSVNIPPSIISSKTHYALALLKFFHNHRETETVFNEDWCDFLFKLSKEPSNQFDLLNAIKPYLCFNDFAGTITKTEYRTVKSSLRLFFYMMWRNKAVLLPFDYKPPKSRSPSNKEWADIGLEQMPEVLQLIMNTFDIGSNHHNLKEHYKASLNTLKSYGYKCVIASTWYTIEDIIIDEAIDFKQFYSELKETNPQYANMSNTLPFNDLLKALYSYAPDRCNFELSDLERLIKKRAAPSSLLHFPQDEFNFKSNVTDTLSVLKKGEALESAISTAYSNTRVVLSNRVHHRHDNSELEELNNSLSRHITFARVFKHGVPASLKTLFHLYELLSYDYVSTSEIQGFTDDEALLSHWDEQYSDNFKSGIRIFLFELYNVEAVLLPLTFDISNRKALKASLARSPELLRIVWNLEELPETIVNRIRSPKFLLNAILSCNWRRVSDITSETALEYQIQYQARAISSRTNTQLPLMELLEYLLLLAPEQCLYSQENLSEVLSDTSAATLLNKRSSIDMPKSPGYRWKQLITCYLAERKQRGLFSENSYTTALGKLVQYISVDLPREFGESSELIPRTPNDFKRYHLIGNSLITHSLKQKLRTKVNNEGFNTNLRAISAFFDWLLDTQYEEEDVSTFKNPVSNLDFLNAPRRGKTDKEAFHGSQFSYVHSFFSSVCEFYWYLITHDLYVEGASNRRELFDTQELGYVPLVMIDGKFYPLYFIPANLTYELLMGSGKNAKLYPQFQTLYENLVALETGLRHLHIRWLDRDSFDVNAVDKEMKYVAELLVNYAFLNESDSIEVGTDKVKTIPWKPYVSGRVLNLLRRLKAFQDSLGVSVPSLWYNGNEGSLHGQIRSLFSSLDATKKKPRVISEGSCASQYRRMLFFFDLFIQLSDVNDVILLGDTPKESLKAIEEAKLALGKTEKAKPKLEQGNLTATQDSVETSALTKHELAKYESEYRHKYLTAFWEASLQNAFYYNGKYETPFTPHGTRSSVASNAIKLLPPVAIKEFITGHESTAVLSYYIQIDPEYLQNVSDFNQLDMLTGAYFKHVDTQKLSEKNRAALKAKLKEVIERDPSLLVKDFGAMSFTTEGAAESIKGGIPILNITPVSNLAFMPTHICPFSGKCPSDILQDVGEMQCGQCYYSIKTVDNIPRILAHIRKQFDGMVEKQTYIKEAKAAGADKPALQNMEKEVYMVSRELAAWIYTYQILDENLEILKDRETNSTDNFFVAKPDILMQHMATGKIENNEVTQLLLRIQDAQSFKEYFTPQLKGKLSKIRKKILIKEQQFEALLNEPSGYDLLDEFRGILKAYTESRNISLEEATRQLSEPLKTTKRSNLLEVVNG